MNNCGKLQTLQSNQTSGACLSAWCGAPWMVVKAVLPKVTRWPGAAPSVLIAELKWTGAPWTILRGAAAARLTVWSTVSGIALIVLTVKSLTWLMEEGTKRKPYSR